MYQAGAFCELAKKIKANSKYDIWCYTGYTFEEIINSHDEKYELLKQTDVLVDGRYIDKLSDPDLAFRGSVNQRIIDVQSSLKANKIVGLPTCLSCGSYLGNDFVERHYRHCWVCYFKKGLDKVFSPLFQFEAN